MTLKSTAVTPLREVGDPGFHGLTNGSLLRSLVQHVNSDDG